MGIIECCSGAAAAIPPSGLLDDLSVGPMCQCLYGFSFVASCCMLLMKVACWLSSIECSLRMVRSLFLSARKFSFDNAVVMLQN